MDGRLPLLGITMFSRQRFAPENFAQALARTKKSPFVRNGELVASCSTVRRLADKMHTAVLCVICSFHRQGAARCGVQRNANGLELTIVDALLDIPYLRNGCTNELASAEKDERKLGLFR